MSDERTQRVAQAISAQMGGTTFDRLAQAMLEAVPEIAEVDRLTEALHAREAHPDFEYTQTETGRKDGEEGYPEHGACWERNTAKGDGRGWERWDYTETNYWRRPKAVGEAEQAMVRKAAEERRDRIVEAGAQLRDLADKARTELVRNKTYWGQESEGSESYRWRRGVTNALGDVELPYAFSPEVAHLFVDFLEMVVDQLDRDYTRWECALFTRADEWAKAFLRRNAPVVR